MLPSPLWSQSESRWLLVDIHSCVSMLVCVAALTMALLVWYRRSTNAVAPLLSLLFADSFCWNFAELARRLTGMETWHVVDRFFSSLMPAIALHVVVRFVGKVRLLTGWLLACYGVFLLLAIGQPRLWWFWLFVMSSIVMSVALVMLFRHRSATGSRLERERAELIMVAIVVGTALGVTDLWRDEPPLNTPPLANVGALLSMALIWIAAKRSRLLDQDIPLRLVANAALVGALLVLGYLADVHWLPLGYGLWGAFAISAAVSVLAIRRDIKSNRAEWNERRARQLLLGRMSEQLAHDLRNPLAALKGSVQYLIAEHELGRSLDLQVPFVQLMQEQVTRLERTVANYQRLARVEPNFQHESLNDLVSDVMAAQKHGLGDSIVVHLDLEPELPLCPIDRDLVALALENLVRNSCEAMVTGGKLTIITRTMSDASATVFLRVQDNGEGMSAREIERAFDEFHTTKPAGTGLGLSFVRRVALAHSGDVHLESEMSKGTAVTLYLPTSDSRPVNLPPARSA